MTGPARHYRVAELAARPDGVTNAELQEEFNRDAVVVTTLMARARELHGLVKVRQAGICGGRARLFASAEAAQIWLAKQEQVRTRVVEARERAAADRKKPRGQPPKAGPGAVATARKAGMTVVPKRLAGTAAADWAAQPAVITEHTKFTVYERSPARGRVDLMADPLPGVPGWRSGPYIRPGSLAPRPQLPHEGGSK